MVFAPLNGRKPKRSKRPERTCLTPGCGVRIGTWKWLCDTCFKALPFPTRKEIIEARAKSGPHVVFGLAREAGQRLAERRIKQAEVG